ncbi:MAG: C25 family cysteine peptidase, partial [Candidatus Freyarchaeota archaeon]
VVDIITYKEFYFVGETVNVTVRIKPEITCFCLVHAWRVSVLDVENRTVFEWSWIAEADEEGYRGKTFAWVPAEAGNYRILAELIDHGSGSKEIMIFDREYADLWIWTSKEMYKPSEGVEIFLHNAGHQTLDGYVQLFISRYENGTWFLVREIEAYVTGILPVDQYFYWEPCYVINWIWNQLDMEGKPVPLGRYRIVWVPYVNGAPIDLYTCEFRIVSPENPKVYLILVESEIYEDVYDEVDQYRKELINNHGVLAYVKTVSRDASAEGLRLYLNGEYNYYLKRGCDFLGAVLIGNLPHVLFEVRNPWSFTLEMNETYKMSFSSHEVFPCDLYFEDLDGVWVDSDGNGILDVHEGDVYPEIFIGRISPNTILKSTKINCIKGYLSKNIAYLKEEASARSKALVYIDDDWDSLAENWAEACSEAFSEVQLISEGASTTASDYAWRLGDGWDGSCLVHVAVHGSPHVHAFGLGGTGFQGILTSLDITSINPKPLFYLLFSCSNARYTSKWYIAGQYIWGGGGLLSISSTKVGGMLFYDNFYSPLGEGCCFGESLKRWFTWILRNNPMGESETKAWFYGITIIGDPILALKPPIFSEVVNVTALYDSFSPITAEITELKIPFDLEAENNIIEVFQGSVNSTYITFTTDHSFCYVELTANAPNGLNVSIHPHVVNLTASKDAQVTVAVKASQNLMGGIYDLTIIAKGNDTIREETFSVIVLADTKTPVIGVPSQDPSADDVQPYQNVTLFVNVTDHESGIDKVILQYSVDNGLTWRNITMSAMDSPSETTILYTAIIPGMPAGTNVQYKIIAYDKAGNVAINDKAGLYMIIPEFSSWSLLILTFLVASLLMFMWKTFRRNEGALMPSR